MIINKIQDNFYSYTFPPRKDDKFGYNIYAILDGENALIIDTGFKKHIKAVEEDLKTKEITIQKVIISHFHLDHILGLKEIQPQEIIGSEEYEKTLNIYVDSGKHHLFTPNSKVEKNMNLKFGDFILDIRKFPGHAQCSLLIEINNKYLHIGDELMYTNQGEDLLPFIGKSVIKRHINSLEKLKKYTHMIFLPSHGKIVDNKEKIENDLENRLTYLKAVYSKSEKISYEEAIKECNTEFHHSYWHDEIYKH